MKLPSLSWPLVLVMVWVLYLVVMIQNRMESIEKDTIELVDLRFQIHMLQEHGKRDTTMDFRLRDTIQD